MILSTDLPKSCHSKKVIDVKCDMCNEKFERRYDRLLISFGIYKKHLCKKCGCKENGYKKRGKKRPVETIEKMLKSRSETISKKYPKLTLACKCCGKDFVVRYGERDRLYCGRSCQAKSVTKTDIRKTSECIICKKEFKHYGERIVCGRKCSAKYLSISRIGENNPAYKGKKITQKCLYCNKEFEYTRSGMRKDTLRVFCSLECSHKIDLKGCGLSNQKPQYPFGWNEKLKSKIKKRDNYSCQMCGILESKCEKKHHIHHIDYDKKNLDEDNLITLCQKCHNITHHGRTFWEIIFSGLLSGSKLVKKDWGCEIHISNNNHYCLKYLVFFKEKQFSFHIHNIKKELWHCVYGKLECVLSRNNKKHYIILKKGNKIEIEPGTSHQLQAIQNSILVEVSTRDYPEDSDRIINGIN